MRRSRLPVPRAQGGYTSHSCAWAQPLACRRSARAPSSTARGQLRWSLAQAVRPCLATAWLCAGMRPSRCAWCSRMAAKARQLFGTLCSSSRHVWRCLGLAPHPGTSPSSASPRLLRRSFLVLSVQESIGTPFDWVPLSTAWLRRPPRASSLRSQPRSADCCSASKARAGASRTSASTGSEPSRASSHCAAGRAWWYRPLRSNEAVHDASTFEGSGMRSL
mmetsp:Transcript_92924/g.258802  ORF Transcript_92924/g.258802 Transcript_92924/m.258802 type:complete len:220 (-) Transcript_92924:133-792(-)